MGKYGPRTHQKVEQALHELKEGELHTGSGKIVTSREQAIAIGLDEARREGDRVPPPPKKKSKKKPATDG